MRQSERGTGSFGNSQEACPSSDRTPSESHHWAWGFVPLCAHIQKGSLSLNSCKSLFLPLSHTLYSTRFLLLSPSLFPPSLACCPLCPVIGGIMSPFWTKGSQMLIRLNHDFHDSGNGETMWRRRADSLWFRRVTETGNNLSASLVISFHLFLSLYPRACSDSTTLRLSLSLSSFPTDTPVVIHSQSQTSLPPSSLGVVQKTRGRLDSEP